MSYQLLAILLSIFVSLPAWANPVKILECESQHSPFDLNYIQGSEAFGSLIYDTNSKKMAFIAESFNKPKTVLYKFKANNKTDFNTQQSTGYIEWENDYASLVFLGHGWGMVIEISPEHPNQEWSGQELELMCEETSDFHHVLK